MDRRGFLKRLIGGVAGAAAVRSFPFRVFSFPTEIAPPMITRMDILPGWAKVGDIITIRKPPRFTNVLLTPDEVVAEVLDTLNRNLRNSVKPPEIFASRFWSLRRDYLEPLTQQPLVVDD